MTRYSTAPKGPITPAKSATRPAQDLRQVLTSPPCQSQEADGPSSYTRSCLPLTGRINKVADKWRLDCCRGATTDEKCFSFRLRLRDILLAYQAFRELTPVFVATVTGRYFEVLHLRIGAAGCQQCARCLPALLRQMDFLRWLSGKGHIESRVR